MDGCKLSHFRTPSQVVRSFTGQSRVKRSNLIDKKVEFIGGP
jgi:hypothetical protein